MLKLTFLDNGARFKTSDFSSNILFAKELPLLNSELLHDNNLSAWDAFIVSGYPIRNTNYSKLSAIKISDAQSHGVNDACEKVCLLAARICPAKPPHSGWTAFIDVSKTVCRRGLSPKGTPA
jgi:hypothetical protein